MTEVELFGQAMLYSNQFWEKIVLKLKFLDILKPFPTADFVLCGWRVLLRMVSNTS